MVTAPPKVWYYPPGAGEESPSDHGGRQILPRDPRARRPDLGQTRHSPRSTTTSTNSQHPRFLPRPPAPLELPGESPCARPPGSGGPDRKPSIGASDAPITGPLPLLPYRPALTPPAPSRPRLIVRILATPRPGLPLQLTSLYIKKYNANATPLSPISIAPEPCRTIDAPFTPLLLRRVRVYHKPTTARLLLLLARAPAPANAPLLVVLLPLDCQGQHAAGPFVLMPTRPDLFLVLHTSHTSIRASLAISSIYLCK